MLQLKIVLSFYCLVTTWDLGHDLIVSFFAEIYVTTLKACRDIISPHLVATSRLSHNYFFLIQLLFQVATEKVCRD